LGPNGEGPVTGVTGYKTGHTETDALSEEDLLVDHGKEWIRKLAKLPAPAFLDAIKKNYPPEPCLM
jgi:hypothetical protein